eukprot:486531_1
MINSKFNFIAHCTRNHNDFMRLFSLRYTRSLLSYRFTWPRFAISIVCVLVSSVLRHDNDRYVDDGVCKDASYIDGVIDAALRSNLLELLHVLQLISCVNLVFTHSIAE